MFSIYRTEEKCTLKSKNQQATTTSHIPPPAFFYILSFRLKRKRTEQATCQPVYS